MTPHFSVRLYEPHYTSRIATIAGESSWALLPVANRPLLCYWLDSLSELGLRHVEVFLYQNQKLVQEHIGSGEAWGLEIAYHSSPGESTAQINLDMSLWCPADQLATIIATTARNGLLMAEKGGLVGFAAFAGSGVPEAAGPLPEISVLHTPQAYLAANFAAIFRSRQNLDDAPVIGYGTYPPSTCKITDPVIIGNHTLVEANTQLGPNVIIGEGCRIGAGSQIENSVILSNVVIPPNSHINNHIISSRYQIDCGADTVAEITSSTNADSASLLGSLKRWFQ